MKFILVAIVALFYLATPFAFASPQERLSSEKEVERFVRDFSCHDRDFSDVAIAVSHVSNAKFQRSDYAKFSLLTILNERIVSTCGAAVIHECSEGNEMAFTEQNKAFSSHIRVRGPLETLGVRVKLYQDFQGGWGESRSHLAIVFDASANKISVICFESAISTSRI